MERDRPITYPIVSILQILPIHCIIFTRRLPQHRRHCTEKNEGPDASVPHFAARSFASDSRRSLKIQFIDAAPFHGSRFAGLIPKLPLQEHSPLLNPLCRYQCRNQLCDGQNSEYSAKLHPTTVKAAIADDSEANRGSNAASDHNFFVFSHQTFYRFSSLTTPCSSASSNGVNPPL